MQFHYGNRPFLFFDLFYLLCGLAIVGAILFSSWKILETLSSF